MLKRFKKWNQWRKRNLNNSFHQILVLIGFIKSPTFGVFLAMDEQNSFFFESIVSCQEEGSTASFSMENWFQKIPPEGLPVKSIEEIDGGIKVTVKVPAPSYPFPEDCSNWPQD